MNQQNNQFEGHENTATPLPHALRRVGSDHAARPAQSFESGHLLNLRDDAAGAATLEHHKNSSRLLAIREVAELLQVPITRFELTAGHGLFQGLPGLRSILPEWSQAAGHSR